MKGKIKYFYYLQSSREKQIMIFVRGLLQKNLKMMMVCRRRYSSLPPSVPRSQQSSVHDEDDPASLSSFIFENLHNNSSRPALVNREEELSFMEVSPVQSSEPELMIFDIARPGAPR